MFRTGSGASCKHKLPSATTVTFERNAASKHYNMQRPYSGGHDHKIDIKVEDPSRGPGRIDFTAPDEGFGLEGTPKPKIQRDPSPPKRKPYMWYAAV